MRNVFPHACYIGFTGTPLLKKEKVDYSDFDEQIRRIRIYHYYRTCGYFRFRSIESKVIHRAAWIARQQRQFDR